MTDENDWDTPSTPAAEATAKGPHQSIAERYGDKKILTTYERIGGLESYTC